MKYLLLILLSLSLIACDESENSDAKTNPYIDPTPVGHCDQIQDFYDSCTPCWTEEYGNGYEVRYIKFVDYNGDPNTPDLEFMFFRQQFVNLSLCLDDNPYKADGPFYFY